jgi:hypothetical protein
VAGDLPIASFIRLAFTTSPQEVAIRIFGVSLLAVAAVAAARLLWKRRREDLIAYFDEDEHRLEELRAAGL